MGGLPEFLGEYLQNPTVEGDNHMLPQAGVKGLLKLVQAVVVGEGGDDMRGISKAYEKCYSRYLITPLVRLTKEADKECVCVATTEDEMMDLDLLVEAFQHRAARLLLEVAQQLQEDAVQKGDDMHTAWNESLVQMSRVSRAHSLAIL